MADETFSEPFGTRPIQLPVTDVFDLHSVPAKDVKEVVEEYLSEAHRLGYPVLRIIHGRGIGVQREMVRQILAHALRRVLWRRSGGSRRMGRHPGHATRFKPSRSNRSWRLKAFRTARPFGGSASLSIRINLAR